MKRFVLKALPAVLAGAALVLGIVLFSKGNSVKATEASPYEKYKEHPFLYLYEKGNVPFDENGGLEDDLFIIPYLAEKPNGTAIVVFPGGAYKFTDNGTDNTGSHQEAGDIAEEFYNDAGISVFVADYRTKTTAPNCDYHGIMADGLRAVRYVRYYAEEFGIDPEKIGVMGFSAGGHLAAMMCTKYDWSEEIPGYTPDEIDKVSAKPCVGILSYGVVSFKDSYCHGSTRTNFLGSEESLYDAFTTEALLTKDTCPLFLWDNVLDSAVPPAANMSLAAKLEELGIRYELHVYNLNEAKHDPGTGQAYANCATWPKLSLAFLSSLGYNDSVK